MKALKIIGFFVSVLILWALCAWANTGYAVNVCTDKELEQIANFEGTMQELADEHSQVAVVKCEQSERTSYYTNYRTWNSIGRRYTLDCEPFYLKEQDKLRPMKRNAIDFFALNFDYTTDLYKFDDSEFLPYRTVSGNDSGAYNPVCTSIFTKDGYEIKFISYVDEDYFVKTGIYRREPPVMELVSFDGKEWNVSENSGGSKDGE